jgi:hypothetical protein
MISFHKEYDYGYNYRWTITDIGTKILATDQYLLMLPIALSKNIC